MGSKNPIKQRTHRSRAEGLVRPENLRVVGEGFDGRIVLLDPDGPDWFYVSPSLAAFICLWDNRGQNRDLLQLFKIDEGQPGKEDPVPTILQELLRIGLLQKKINPGPDREPAPRGEPTTVSVYLTRRCNLSCRYCFYDAGRSGEKELDTGQALQLLDQIAALGVKRVNFMGGEPLLREDLFLLAGRARERGLEVNLITNGTLITPDVARKIKEHFPLLQVSLDGLEAEHDFVRGAGGFDRALQGIKNLLDEEIPFAVSCIISRINRERVGEFMEFLISLGVPYFHCVNLQAHGRGACHQDMTLSFGRYIETLFQLYKKYHGPIAINQFAQLLNIKPGVRKDNCGAGELMVEIDADGKVYPCYKFMSPPYAAGDVRCSGLAEIYRDSPVLRRLGRATIEITPDCLLCDVRYFCGGGCLAERLQGNDKNQCEEKKTFWHWVLLNTREGQWLGQDFTL